MLSLILHWLVSGLALLVTSALVPGFKIKNFSSSLIAAILIGLVGYTVGWILLVLTLPLTILTLGLFVFVVDAIVLKLCAAMLKGFEITSWGSAIFGALILALVSSVLHYALI